MGIQDFTNYAGWVVGIAATIFSIRIKLKSTQVEENTDFREEVSKLIVIKDQIIKEREAQAEDLKQENFSLKNTITDLETRLEDMNQRIKTLESQHGRALEQLLESASRTTLCLNAQTCLNRVIPTPDN